MNLLGIDIGNTHSQIGIFANHKLVSSIRVSSSQQRTEDEFWFYIEQFLYRLHVAQNEISDVVISSVVPSLNFIFNLMSQKYFGKEAFFIHSGLNLGIKINYSIPEQVGADRLCNAVAAYQLYRNNLIIIDFGTATTFDVVFAEGTYEGGIIAPGLETTNWGLHQKAAKLPRVKLEFPDRVVGKNTDDAIQSGLMFGEVAMIDGIIDQIKREENRIFKIMATGGLAGKVVRRLENSVEYRENLLMEGLYEIYRKNR